MRVSCYLGLYFPGLLWIDKPTFQEALRNYKKIRRTGLSMARAILGVWRKEPTSVLKSGIADPFGLARGLCLFLNQKHCFSAFPRWHAIGSQ